MVVAVTSNAVEVNAEEGSVSDLPPVPADKLPNANSVKATAKNKKMKLSASAAAPRVQTAKKAPVGCAPIEFRKKLALKAIDLAFAQADEV